MKSKRLFTTAPTYFIPLFVLLLLLVCHSTSTASAVELKPARTIGTPLVIGATSFTTKSHPLRQTKLWGQPVSKRPFPTNEWWTSLVLESGNNPVKTYPYLLKAGNKGLHVCFPGRTVTKESIFETFVDNLMIEAYQGMGARRLMDYGKLHATMRWNAGSGGGFLTSPIVRGQVYNTVVFSHLRPRIRSVHVITQVNGQQSTNGATFSGKKFKISMNNGQTWILYAEKDITLTTESTTSLLASGNYNGYMRVALLQSNAANTESILDAHSNAYPVSGTVTHEVLEVLSRFDAQGRLQSDKGRVKFTFQKEGSQSTPLLMFALPHHQDSLVNPQYPTADVRMQSIKGHVRAVIGDSWTMEEQLTNVGFGAMHEIPESEKANLRRTLQEDKNMQPAVQDPYFGGKAMAKIARLALIADDLGEESTARELRNRIKSMMEPWLNGASPNHLVYDKNWGGVVTKGSLANPGAEFGMGWYNDHHFHFGYWVYAAAAVMRHDSEWAHEYRTKIVDLVRDYANPVADDQFPQFRHKDWYTGHSFASGLADFADIKNQESTSEAVNGYYAMVLLGRALQNQNLYDLGRMLLATEIRATHKYWHMKSDSDIYEEVFKANKLVGIVWETKVDYSTFFGSNLEFIHCIQMMPFTPITEELLPADFIREEYEVLKTALTRSSPRLQEGWKGFIYMAHSIFDKQAGRREIDTLRSYDDGNTKTNTLHFVVTRPGPDNPNIVYEPTPEFIDDGPYSASPNITPSMASWLLMLGSTAFIFISGLTTLT